MRLGSAFLAYKIQDCQKPETGAVLFICAFEDGHVEGIHVDKVGQPCKPLRMNLRTSWSVLPLRMADRRSQTKSFTYHQLLYDHAVTPL